MLVINLHFSPPVGLFFQKNEPLKKSSLHPPFQIDGNFGGTAGVCEMLMQCDGETMNLLPALPQEWQAGEIRGLKARGNYGVSLAWNKGKLTQATINSKNEGNLTILYNGKQKILTFKAGETKTIR